MEELAPLREDEPKGRGSRGKYRALIEDAKTQQEVLIVSDEPLAAYALDDENRKWWLDTDDEKRPDAVLLAHHQGHSYVIFIDLTYSMKPRVHQADKKGSTKAVAKDPSVRKMEQLQSALDHFHPAARSASARTHGDEHHDRWAAGQDQPDPLPAREHRVGGIVLSFHHQARVLPLVTQMGERTVKRAVWSPVPSAFKKAEITITDLLRNFGWAT
jgi:hypothetical protein